MLSIAISLEKIHFIYWDLIDWDCKIDRLDPCGGGKTPPLQECPGYDTKQLIVSFL